MQAKGWRQDCPSMFTKSLFFPVLSFKDQVSIWSRNRRWKQLVVCRPPKKEAVTWTSNKRPHILFCKLGSCSCQECSKCQSPLVLSLLECIIINPFHIHLLESTVSLVRKKPKTGEWRHQATWKQLWAGTSADLWQVNICSISKYTESNNGY